MPQNVTDVSVFTDPIVEMADSDPADATYVRTAIQGLANRTRWTKDAGLDPLAYFRAGDGSLFYVDDATIGWDGFAALGLPNGAHVSFGGLAANSLAPVLAASTWYYVYATWSGGASIDISTTGPASGNGYTTKTGDLTRRYLGCFRTDASSHVVPFTCRRGRYVYRWSKRTDYTFWNALAAGNATILTSVPLKDSGGALELVPPHARQVIVRAETSNGAGTNQGAQIVTYGDTGTGYQTVAVPSGLASDVFEIECDSAQRLKYLVTDAAVHLTLSVMGFQE